ncbi:tetratricopeptide repeat protein [Marinisporobacter balticus]|uniref:Tetratricopeptide repeat protein n=1 Tax=Marinisporobacter balticus TaxID=2018667 RepID=A0A4V2SAI6_9FIRM|nr:tetratricopeptide repeat protein [Marinisporobacter balticus]TCO71840.1 tetratricopeptide repeat protein [Marinisporobacter balticus]
MKGFIIYFLLSSITGNPLMAFLGVIIIYSLIDRFYLGFLPDFTRIFRRNRQMKNSLKELQVNPQNASATFSIGILYFEKKKYEEALKYLEHPKLKDNETANFYYYMGMTLMKLKRSDEGKDYIMKALEVNPRIGYGLPYIALIDHEMEKYAPDRHIINDLEEKIEKFANTENLYKLGRLYKKLGNKEKAKNLFSKAMVEYSYCPKGIRRIHRKWAILSRVYKIV